MENNVEKKEDSKIQKCLGNHIILDIYECDSKLLNDVDVMRKILVETTQEIGAKVVSEGYKKFSPVGISAFVIITESHISVHTWPEHRYAAVDIFSCNKIVAEDVLTSIMDKFKAKSISMYSLQRGKLLESSDSTKLTKL